MTDSKKKPKIDGNISIDLGFGNLFKGLGSFLDVVSDLSLIHISEPTRPY